MIDLVATSLSWILLAAGAFYFFVGALGLVRMPDVFTRMHAGSIGDTAGAGLILAGMVLAVGISLVSVKLLVILATILFTSPIVTHALAQAAMHAGVEPVLAGKGGRSAPGSKAPVSKKASPKTRRRGRSGKAKEATQ